MASSHAATQPRIRTWLAALALVGAAQALPWLVHLLGLPGPLLLPLHFAAILAGIALGPVPGLLNGLAAPVVSFLLTGLPPAPLVPVMAVEVAAYGGAAGYLAHRTAWRGAWILMATLAAGRAAALAALGVAGMVLGFGPPPVRHVLNGLLTGWPGIAFQFLLLSVVARRLVPVDRA
jgi:hypothetical protein